MMHAFGETNGLAHLARPIGRIDSFLARDRRSGEAGYPKLAGCLRTGCADDLLEGFDDRINRRRMERVRRFEPTISDRVFGQFTLESMDCIMSASGNNQ